MHKHLPETRRLLLPVLEPPAGGLTRLQRAVRQSRDGTRARALGGGRSWATAAALALCALLAVTLVPAAWQQHAQSEALARAVQHALAPASGEITIAHGAALSLPTGSDGVRIYLVQTSGAF
jgi:hypothetical protein